MQGHDDASCGGTAPDFGSEHGFVEELFLDYVIHFARSAGISPLSIVRLPDGER